MKKRILSAILIASMALAGCSSSSAPASSTDQAAPEAASEVAAGQIVLKLADPNTETSMFHLGLLEIADAVEASTNGAVAIEVYANAQLGDVAAATDSVRMGTIDMAITQSSTLASIVPEFAVLDAPFVVSDDDHALRIANGDVGDFFNDKLDDHGLNVIGWFCGGARNIFSTKPITSMEDLHGVKIRTMSNAVHMDTFNALGAIATPMAYSELYTALQQGTVDAGENAIDNVLTANFYEVCPYVTLTAHFYNFLQVVISDAALEKMSDEVRAQFLEGCKTGTERANELIRKQNDSSMAKLQELGVEFYTIDHDQLAEAVAPVYEKYASDMPADIVEMVRNA